MNRLIIFTVSLMLLLVGGARAEIIKITCDIRFAYNETTTNSFELNTNSKLNIFYIDEHELKWRAFRSDDRTIYIISFFHISRISGKGDMYSYEVTKDEYNSYSTYDPRNDKKKEALKGAVNCYKTPDKKF